MKHPLSSHRFRIHHALAAVVLLGGVATITADTLPESNLTCGASHVYENESNRAVTLTVQVFNGCSGLEDHIDINLFTPDDEGRTVRQIRERETRSLTLLVPSSGAVQVRGPGGSGGYRSVFSVIPR
jgi:hypothetical protein